MLREVKIKNQKKQFVESSELKYKGGVMKTFIRTLILQLLCICICFAGNKKQDVFHGARIIYDEHSGVPTSLEFKGDNKPKAESFFQMEEQIVVFKYLRMTSPISVGNYQGLLIKQFILMQVKLVE